jgi:hypothetical protein
LTAGCCEEYLGPKRDEIVEGWRKLHNEEIHNLYSSHNIIKMIKQMTMKGVGHVARIEAKLKAYRILMGKPEGNRKT